MKAPLHLFEDHCGSYVRWREAGLKGVTCIHADAHLDLKDEGLPPAVMDKIKSASTMEELEEHHRSDDLLFGGFHLGNYLYPAALDGTVSKLIWVIPPHLPGSQYLLEWSLGELQNWKDLTLEEYGSLKYEGRRVVGTLAGIPFEVCLLEDLKVEKGERLVWDIDVDYFFDENDVTWISPADFTEKISLLAPDPLMVTIAYSVGGGYTAPHQKYVGDMIKDAISGTSPETAKDDFENLRIGDQLLCRGNSDEAKLYFSKVSDEPLLKPYVRMRDAEILRIKGRERRAEVIMDEIHKSRPDLVIPDHDMAMVHFRRKEYKEALDILKKSETVSSDLFLLSNFISSLIRVKMQNFEDAQIHWDRIIAHEVFPGLAPGIRAHIYRRAGENAARIPDHQKAVELLTHCIGLDDMEPSAYIHRGAAYFNMGQYRRAVQDYRKYLCLKGDYLDSLDVHNSLAKAYRMMGRLQLEKLEMDTLVKKDVTGKYRMKSFLKNRKARIRPRED